MLIPYSNQQRLIFCNGDAIYITHQIIKEFIVYFFVKKFLSRPKPYRHILVVVVSYIATKLLPVFCSTQNVVQRHSIPSSISILGRNTTTIDGNGALFLLSPNF